jgi:hypothetical protein
MVGQINGVLAMSHRNLISAANRQLAAHASTT